MSAPGNERGQMLLAEEYFASEDGSFLETLRQVTQPKSLAAFADRWKKDPRPWARQQIFAYLNQPLDCPGHQPVVKHLFKHAEENKDHELMGSFLVAFDRQVRRKAQLKGRWDFQTRTAYEEERLVAPRNVLPLKGERAGRNPMTGLLMSSPIRVPANARLFSYRTRYYLRRRVWRYFRLLGYRDPAAYVLAVSQALALFEDADLQRGENILDSWSLIHACFGAHEALEFGATHVRLKDGRSLAELTAAPGFVDAWKRPESAPPLLALAVHARARLVRVWSTQLFLREHAAYPVPFEVIRSLLEHADPEVQQFGAQLLRTSPALATLPVESWLKLLETKNNEALQIVCEAFAQHVTRDRLTLAQCVQMACLQPVPLARMGLNYLKQFAIASAPDREQIARLADAACAAVAAELAAMALPLLAREYQADQIMRFLDARLAGIRVASWDWLIQDARAQGDATLWSRLIETPYDDLRLRVVDYLQRATSLPGTDANQLETIWRSVLLGVHRGGRQKAKAVQQVAQAIIANPPAVDSLLPVLVVAVRSIRGPEMRAGLAAVMRIVEARPAFAEIVQRLLPELKFAGVTP
jgi:hypothetical protein